MINLSKMQKAFLEGFKSSGEGFNGEYPFDGDTDEIIWSRIEDRFKEIFK